VVGKFRGISIGLATRESKEIPWRIEHGVVARASAQRGRRLAQCGVGAHRGSPFRGPNTERIPGRARGPEPLPKDTKVIRATWPHAAHKTIWQSFKNAPFRRRCRLPSHSLPGLCMQEPWARIDEPIGENLACAKGLPYAREQKPATRAASYLQCQTNRSSCPPHPPLPHPLTIVAPTPFPVPSLFSFRGLLHPFECVSY
jgi:hypothetical protein